MPYPRALPQAFKRIKQFAYPAIGGINVVLRTSYAGAAKSATTAFWIFLAFYVVCVAVTWMAYVRRRDTTSLV